MGIWWIAYGAFIFLSLVLYYILVAKAVVEMLRYGANPILLTFGFIALIPAPPLIVMGAVLIIIWRKYREAQPGGLAA
jgi:hypothetical protein